MDPDLKLGLTTKMGLILTESDLRPINQSTNLNKQLQSRVFSLIH